MFDLKSPCVDCPFRRGVGSRFALGRARLMEILGAKAFQCHKTVDYSANTRKGRTGDKPQQCAGLMAVLWRERQPNLIMRVALATGHLDATELDPRNEAYASVAELMKEHMS
jgi:hypothetical protein